MDITGLPLPVQLLLGGLLGPLPISHVVELIFRLGFAIALTLVFFTAKEHRTVRLLILSLAAFVVVGLLGLIAAYAVALAFLIVALAFLIVGLIFLLFLQAVKLVRRIPYSYNVRNLMVRWPSTLLTALAFVLVIGLMTVMLAFVNGLYKLTQGSGQPGNVFVLADGATDELFSNLGEAGDITLIANRAQQDEAGGHLVSYETYVVVNQPIPGAKKGDRARRFMQVRGVVDPVISGRVHNLPLNEGGAWFNEVQTVEDEGKPVEAIQAVLGEGMARELGHDRGKPSLGPGDVFDLGPRKWVVTGVLQSAGSTFDSEVWAKQSRVGEMFGKPSYTTVVLRTTDAAAARSLADDLTKNYKTPAVSAQPETDYYEKLNNTNQQFLYTIVFIVIIMAVGGVFGVMNAMFAAVSQRTKDIGVLRSWATRAGRC